MHTVDAVVVPFPVPPRRGRRRAPAAAGGEHFAFLHLGGPWTLSVLPSPDSPEAAAADEPLVFSLSC